MRDLVEQLERVAALAVHLVDERRDRHVAQAADLEQLAGLGLDALRGVDHHDGRVDRGQRAVRVLAEVLVARRVEQVERAVRVVERHHGRRHARCRARARPSSSRCVARRRSPRALTAPASWIAPPNSSSFSVSVVLPASGCAMIANVRRFAIAAGSSRRWTTWRRNLRNARRQGNPATLRDMAEDARFYVSFEDERRDHVRMSLAHTMLNVWRLSNGSARLTGGFTAKLQGEWSEFLGLLRPPWRPVSDRGRHGGRGARSRTIYQAYRPVRRAKRAKRRAPRSRSR